MRPRQGPKRRKASGMQPSPNNNGEQTMKKEIKEPNEHLSCVQPGYQNRFPKYRLAWSDEPEVWDPKTNANAAYYKLKKEGKADISYFRASAGEIAYRFPNW
jgi:hypothetical protein